MTRTKCGCGHRVYRRELWDSNLLRNPSTTAKGQRQRPNPSSQAAGALESSLPMQETDPQRVRFLHLRREWDSNLLRDQSRKVEGPPTAIAHKPAGKERLIARPKRKNPGIVAGVRSGGSGIRTHGGITSTVFKTVAFVRSAIPPDCGVAPSPIEPSARSTLPPGEGE